jgi:hypothetical protein
MKKRRMVMMMMMMMMMKIRELHDLYSCRNKTVDKRKCLRSTVSQDNDIHVEID